MIKKRIFLLSAILIVFSCLFFFAAGIFFDKKTILWDAADEFFPSLWYTGHLWKSGTLPLWNPFLFNGYPIFADPQNQTFYPLNIIISLLTVFSAKVVYLQLVLHFILAGIFMYLFAGFYVQTNTGRIIAAFIYMFNGFMVNHFQHLTMINSVVWLPLILFFLEKGWRRQALMYFFPAGISIAFLILAGHPQTLLYIFYILVFFTLFKCLYADPVKRFSFFPAKLFFFAMLFGISVSAVQLIPSYELSTMANRSGPLPYWIVTEASGQLYPYHLVTLFLANYFGLVKGPYAGLTDIAHSSIYCGGVFLIFLPYSLKKNKKEAYFFLGMGLLTVLISMGDFGVIFRFFGKYMPGFDLFRSPVQYRFGLAFFAAILAAMGFDNIMNGNMVRRGIKFSYWALVFLIIAGMVIFAMTTPLKEKLLSHVINNALLFTGLFLTFSFLLALWERKKVPVYVLQAVVLILTFSDFYMNGSCALTIGAEMGHGELEKEPALVKSLKGVNGRPASQGTSGPFLSAAETKSGLYRVYVDDGLSRHTELLPYLSYSYLKLGVVGFNRAMLHKVFLVDGYNPLLLKRYVLFNGILRDSDYQKFIILSNVKYIIRPDYTIEVLPDDKTLSRSYLVTSTEYVGAPGSVIDKLSSPAFDVRQEAIVEDPAAQIRSGACAEREARVVEYLPGRVTVVTKGDCPALLVLSDSYYPGWKARINSGAWTDALRVNYCFMGALVPSGRHRVIFEFVPTSFKIGSTVSAVSMIAGMIIVLVRRRIKK